MGLRNWQWTSCIVLYADYFEKVFATDISEKQIANAASHPKIIYSISEAEKTLFADNTFDLITWFHKHIIGFSLKAFIKKQQELARMAASLHVGGISLQLQAMKR